MNRRGSLVIVVLSAACFSTLAIFTNLAYAEGVRPLPLLTWRFAIVTALMAVYQLSHDRAKLVSGARDMKAYILMSITGYGAASICYFYALKFASASVVAVLLYTYPAMVALLSWLMYREPLTKNRLLAIALTFIGCALVVGLLTSHVSVTLRGVLLGLGAAFGYSIFNMLSHTLVGKRPRIVVMTYTFGLSAIALAVVTFASGESLSVAAWSGRLWVLLGLIVLIPTFAAVVLYLRGIRALGPSQAAIVSTMEPIFTIALAAVFLAERLTAMQLLGVLFVISGVVAAEWRTTTPVATDEFAAV
ncbi:MAG: EamA family transporter [Coriobacteriia bacterium]|nr:EamA family transporter [Coriobacteriia bacterium]